MGGIVQWAKVAVLLLDLVGQFVRWVEQEKITTDAERALIANARKQIDANVAVAEDARRRVRDRIAANPDGLRDDSWGHWRED